MPELNKANRQVCDVDIRVLKTKAPFLKFDTANTTTAGLSGDSVYAMAKGSRRIAFANPLEGTMTIEAQVYPFKFFALLSDGVVESSAVYADSKTITAVAGGSLALGVTNGTIQAGSVFVYPAGQFGDEAALIAGTYSDGTFTATNSAAIVANNSYEVGYIVSRTSGVKKITFNNNKLPKDYFITMKTVDKDEDGTLTPFVMTAYKASVQRNFELSFSSEGDPASVTLTFDLMEDKDGNIFDMVEISEDAMGVSLAALRLAIGGTSPDIKINGANGAVSATVKDSSDATYAKISVTVSGDNDTLIIKAADDATAGNYKVILTDSTSGTAQTAEIAVVLYAAG